MSDSLEKDNGEFSNDTATHACQQLSASFKGAAHEDCQCTDGDLGQKPVLVSREFEKTQELFSNNIIGIIIQRLEAVPQLNGSYDIYFRNKLFYDRDSTYARTQPSHDPHEYNGVDIATKYPSSRGFSLDEIKALFSEYEKSCQADKPLPALSLDQKSYWLRPLKFLDTGCLCHRSFDSQCVLKNLCDFNYSKIGPLLGHARVLQAES